MAQIVAYMVDYSFMNGKYLVSFDGAKIYYHKTLKNKNRWLIFLHGLGGDLTAWEKERAYFTRLGISTIAMDLRGHGLSDRSDNKNFYKLENFSKDVAALIEKEKLRNVVLIGHCFGGIISIYNQSYYPGYSSGLVLINTSYKAPFFRYNTLEKTLLKYIFQLLLKLPNLRRKGHADFDKFVGTPDIHIKRFLSDVSHTSLHSYLNICQHLVDLNVDGLLDQIEIPTLIIWGMDDILFPPKTGEYMNKKIKKSHLVQIEGANHILIINNPKDIQKNIAVFLKKIKF